MVAVFVLLTFILFIAIDLLVLKAQKKPHPAFAPQMQSNDLLVFNRESISIPEGLFFSKGHTWAQKNEYGLIKVGIDDFVIKALGKFSLKKTAEAGTRVKKGDVIFEGGFNGKSLQFRSPVEGTVQMANTGMMGQKITDPYGDNWGVMIAAENFKEGKESLLSGSELTDWLKSEFKKFKDFLGHHTPRPELAGITMQDGGNIVEGALASVTEQGLEDFEKEFLTF